MNPYRDVSDRFVGRVRPEKSPKSELGFAFGVSSIVCAAITLGIGWIPFLGVLAIPLGVIALLLALAGLICTLASKKRGLGLPFLGLALSMLSVLVPVGITKAIIKTEGFRYFISELDKNINVDFYEQLNDSLRTEVQVVNLQCGLDEDGKPNLSFDIRNNSEKTLKYVRVTCHFMGPEGDPVWETEFTPVSWHGTPEGSVKSLLPGEIWYTDQESFFGLSPVLTEDWEVGSVKAEVSKIEISM